MIVGRVSEHQGAFVGQIHVHDGFADGADRNVGAGFGNGQRGVDVNVHFVFGFDDRENGFGSQFGQTGFALVVFQTVFVFAQTNGDVAVGEKDPTYGGYGAPEGPAIQGNIMLIGADGAESDALKLNYSVKGLLGRQVLYTARQNGTVLTLDVPASVATFRCTMEDLTTMMNNGINTLVFKTEKTSTTLNLSLLTEGYDADAKVKLHQCGSTVRLSVNGRGRRDLLIGR